MKAVATTEKQSPVVTGTNEQRQFTLPEVNIFETNEGYIIEAEMPGVPKEGLEITLDNNELTITGHRKSPAPPGQPLFRESRDVDFRRVFQLDPAIDTAKVSARMDQGVLALTLPKSERVKPRKVNVD